MQDRESQAAALYRTSVNVSTYIHAYILHSYIHTNIHTYTYKQHTHIQYTTMKIYVYIENGKCNIVDGNFRFQYNALSVEEKVESMNIIQLEAPGDNEIIRFIYACASLCKCVYITLTVLLEDITYPASCMILLIISYIIFV